MAPPFFFSYAHNDASFDRRIFDFYKEINRRVRIIAGAREDGFFDETRLLAGEEWSAQVVAALRSAPAMVCAYSSSYFVSQVCGQELQVYLERRQQYLKQQRGGRRPGNIIPVRWVKKEPPLTLPDFQYERPRSQEFKDVGVWEMLDQVAADPALAPIANREYDAIARAVATRVKESLDTPLPDLGYTPKLGGLSSAFEPSDMPPAEFNPATAGGPETATFIYADSSGWRELPFAPPEKHSWLYIAASVAQGKDLKSRALTFSPTTADLLDRVKAVHARNSLLVLLVDGRSLNDARLVERFRQIDQERYETCSALVVWPPGNTAPGDVPAAFPKLSERRPPFFHSSLDSHAAFEKAVGESLDALQNSMLKNAQNLPPLPPTSSYSLLPSVSATSTDGR